jgi:hypothetical protein
MEIPTLRLELSVLQSASHYQSGVTTSLPRYCCQEILRWEQGISETISMSTKMGCLFKSGHILPGVVL